MKTSTPSLTQFIYLLTTLYATSCTAIVGGTKVTNATHPYAVGILAHPSPGEPYFTCAGSIIGLNTILTSASCVEGRETLSIRHGSHDRTAGGSLADVCEIIMHPDYDNNTLAFDFAILRLAEEIETEKGTLGIVKLPEEDSYADGGEKYQVAGWGKTTSPSVAKRVAGSESLLEGDLQAVDRAACSSSWGKTIGESQMCVEHTAENTDPATSICDGDSGGPLVDEAGEVLQGVVYYGEASCETGVYPNVFSSVFSAREWILENLV